MRAARLYVPLSRYREKLIAWRKVILSYALRKKRVKSAMTREMARMLMIHGGIRSSNINICEQHPYH